MNLMIAVIALNVGAWGAVAAGAWKLASTMARLEAHVDTSKEADTKTEKSLNRAWEFARHNERRIRALEFRAGIHTPAGSSPQDFGD